MKKKRDPLYNYTVYLNKQELNDLRFALETSLNYELTDFMKTDRGAFERTRSLLDYVREILKNIEVL
jgi:hypothetical protein